MLAERFSPDDARRVKEIERRTNHDVKAVEYLIAERLSNDAELTRIRPFLHFACTSEDINNISYALMLRHGRDDLLLPQFRQIVAVLDAMSRSLADTPHAGQDPRATCKSNDHGQGTGQLVVATQAPVPATARGRAAGQNERRRR